MLRCAGACANEAGNGLSGPARDLVLSVMHLVELTKGYVDKSLDTLSSTRLIGDRRVIRCFLLQDAANTSTLTLRR